MNDWNQFTKSHNENFRAGGKPPSVIDYFFIQIIDNGLVSVTVFLLIIFVFGAVISEIKAVNELSKWFIHSSEMLLGLIVGLFKKK